MTNDDKSKRESGARQKWVQLHRGNPGGLAYSGCRASFSTLGTSVKAYRIKDWAQLYENNRTRELRKLDWVPIPNKMDGDGFSALIARPDGLEVFGAWVLIVEIASKCQPRGTLIRGNGEPHTAESMARMARIEEAKMANALETLTGKSVGWMEEFESSDVDRESSVTQYHREAVRRGNGRMNRALAGVGVRTPLGIVKVRPDRCQWCGKEGIPGGKGMPGIVGHHLLGYGKSVDDFGIFVCRSCHGNFENQNISIDDVLERFGSTWFAVSCLSQITAIGSQKPSPEGNGREGKEENGEKGEEEEAAPPSSHILQVVKDLKSGHPDFLAVGDWAIINTLRDYPEERWDEAVRSCVNLCAGGKIQFPVKKLRNFLEGKPENKSGGFREPESRIK